MKKLNMQHRLQSLILLATTALATASAESPFSGTWRLNYDESTLPDKSLVLLLEKGEYQCLSCVPVVHLRVGGTAQPIDHGETMQVKEIDSNTATFVIYDRSGKISQEYTRQVSADGRNMTTHIKYSYENGQSSVSEVVWLRLKAGPPGANKISGSWRQVRSSASEKDLISTYKVNGDDIEASGSPGWSFRAKLDGKEYPVKGVFFWTAVSLKRVNEHSFEETDKLNGKVIARSTVTVSADGKKMTVTDTFADNGELGIWISYKQ